MIVSERMKDKHSAITVKQWNDKKSTRHESGAQKPDRLTLQHLPRQQDIRLSNAIVCYGWPKATLACFEYLSQNTSGPPFSNIGKWFACNILWTYPTRRSSMAHLFSLQIWMDTDTSHASSSFFSMTSGWCYETIISFRPTKKCTWTHLHSGLAAKTVNSLWDTHPRMVFT